MPLLLDSDYEALKERGVAFHEDPSRRLLIFRDVQLSPGMYAQSTCDVLVQIPPNYNQDGNDMLWTHPRVVRTDGMSIPNSDEAGSNSVDFEGRIYCRWSRHWTSGASVWRPGRDDVVTILRRITWALNHPDTK